MYGLFNFIFDVIDHAKYKIWFVLSWIRFQNYLSRRMHRGNARDAICTDPPTRTIFTANTFLSSPKRYRNILYNLNFDPCFFVLFMIRPWMKCKNRSTNCEQTKSLYMLPFEQIINYKLDDVQKRFWISIKNESSEFHIIFIFPSLNYFTFL